MAVDCGNEYAYSCAACARCSGDCTWRNGACVKWSDYDYYDDFFDG